MRRAAVSGLHASHDLDGHSHRISVYPEVADLLTSFGKGLEALAKAGVAMKYAQVHKVLGEGNFVLVMSEDECGG
jgi:hypothetical protein